eukprot:13877751-Alexandrium_andersonii.AAC.1
MDKRTGAARRPGELMIASLALSQRWERFCKKPRVFATSQVNELMRDRTEAATDSASVQGRTLL